MWAQRIARILLLSLLWVVLGTSALTWGHAPKTVLVTGATGFIGQNLVRFLLGKGLTVRVFVRDASKLSPDLASRVEIFQGDISVAESLIPAVSGVDTVFHVAAFVSDYTLQPEAYGQTNHLGTQNVVNNCLAEANWRRGPVRLVHFSTVDVLNFKPGQLITDESAYVENSPYGYPSSKAAAEKYVFKIFNRERQSGNQFFEATAIRPTWVFGPGDRNFLPGLVQALKSGTPVLIGGRQKVLHLSYIENLMEATWLLATRSEAVGEAFINDDGGRTWGWLVDLVHSELGVKRPFLESIPFFCGKLFARLSDKGSRLVGRTERPDLTPFVVDYLFSNMRYSAGKLQTTFDYQPRFSIEDAMQRTLRDSFAP